MKTVRFKYVLNEIIRETEEFLNLITVFFLVEATVIEWYNGNNFQKDFIQLQTIQNSHSKQSIVYIPYDNSATYTRGIK